MSEALHLGGLAFEVRRSARRRTIALTVDRGGELVLHAPNHAPADDLERWTRGKLVWVHRKLALKEQSAPKGKAPEFVSGEGFSYLGRSYRLAVVDRQEIPLKFDGWRFVLRRDARADGTEFFQRWYIEAGSPDVARRTALFTTRVAATPARTEVRDLGFRWGSCGKNGVLYFNWRLLQLPLRLVDYVVCHELVHLREPHHGKAFAALLDRVQPDWQVRKDELAKKALAIHWCGAGMG